MALRNRATMRSKVAVTANGDFPTPRRLAPVTAEVAVRRAPFRAAARTDGDFERGLPEVEAGGLVDLEPGRSELDARVGEGGPMTLPPELLDQVGRSPDMPRAREGSL